MKKACVFTLGCKLNQYESFSIMRSLMAEGYDVVEGLELADLYVVNTCAVTAEAERKSRQVIAKIRKFSLTAKIVVCGCASQKNADRFLIKDNQLLVMGNFNKGQLVRFLELSGKHVAVEPDQYEDDLTPCKPRTREYIKVQDGCNNYCSYCIVPYLRGHSRSRSLSSIVSEIQSFSGVCREFILTGINLSDYGRNIGGSLQGLMSALQDCPVRLRLGSLEVNVITTEFLQTLASVKRFCPHFHLSLQSGSNQVLKAMNRKYSREEFLEAVRLIRSIFPDAAITTDIICGYPTESDSDFMDTIDLCYQVAFADIHVFPYSRREGTKAAALPVLDGQIVLARAHQLTAVKAELKSAYIAKQCGRKLNLLAEEMENGCATGYTENYIQCYVSQPLVLGMEYHVILGERYLDGAIAVLSET